MIRLGRRLLRSKFFLYSVDRMSVSFNLVANSIILANAVDSLTAGVYFFSASLTQLLVLPWIPALEMSWSGTVTGADRKRPVPVFFSECLALTLPSAVACLVILLFASPRADLFLLVSLPAVAATALTSLHMLLVSMRYDETPRYVAISVAANLAALALKVALALGGADRLWILLSLFTDVVFVALATLAIWLRRFRGVPIRFPRPDRGRLLMLVWSALSIYAMLFMGRSLLVFARFSLDDRDYAATGFAFQLVNVITPLVSALMYTVRSHTGDAYDDKSHVGALLRKSVWLVLAITAAYCAGVWLLARPIVDVLMPEYAELVVRSLKFMIPYVPAALLAGLAISIAPHRPISLTLTMCLSGLIGGIAFLLPIGELGPRLLLWSCTMLAGAMILIAMLRPRRARP